MSSAVPTTVQATAAPATETIAAKIPAPEITQLQALAGQGLLSGVDPAILAAQIQAESSGQGGGINPAGYGGYFGLAANTPYGAQGAQVTEAQLTGTDVASFDAQAQTAAALDASLLQQYGGSTAAMEQAYQLGQNSPLVGTSTATQGTAVFAQDAVPAVDPPAGAVLTGIWSDVGHAAGSFVGGVVGGAAGATVSAWGPMLLKLVFVVAALGVIALGFARMFPGVTRTVTSTAQTAAVASTA